MEIIKDALASLREEKLLFFIFPFLFALGLGCFTYFIDPTINIVVDVVGPIGIFSALMFSVIFIVVEHFLKRRLEYSSNDEEAVRYLENYKDFTRNTVVRISFSILLAGLIILLAFILKQITIETLCFKVARNTIFVYFILQYMALIIIVVKDMYAMLIDDIERNK